MMSFRGGRLGELKPPLSIVWQLNDIAEGKGTQILYTKQSPQVLNALREIALVQSVESSNRIEGVTVAQERLRPLVLGNARPRDRSEKEIQGYRRALELIHARAKQMDLSPELICKLHGVIQSDSGDAGQWKRVDNDIIELRLGAAPLVRFRPTAAAGTKAAIEELCLSYRHCVAQSLAPPLITAAAFVLDFLCIHPFRDGNGRVSRLLTLLLLYHFGYEVGRYVSLERLVEEGKEGYYEALLRGA
jgi:Fic family protein